jgi:hypothetical protein
MNSYAVVSNTTGLVKTFIRSDLTHGYPPPEGYSLMPDDSLPEGWQKEPLVVEVPESVRAAQLRQWLIDQNLDELVEAKLSSSDNWPDIKTWKKAKARYEYEPLVNRNDPLVEALGLDLGMTDTQMDDAFVQMSQIE